MLMYFVAFKLLLRNGTFFFRCQLWGKAMENKELKENIEKLTKALKQSEAFRIGAYRQQYLAGKMITNAEVRPA